MASSDSPRRGFYNPEELFALAVQFSAPAFQKIPDGDRVEIDARSRRAYIVQQYDMLAAAWAEIAERR